MTGRFLIPAIAAAATRRPWSLCSCRRGRRARAPALQGGQQSLWRLRQRHHRRVELALAQPLQSCERARASPDVIGHPRNQVWVQKPASAAAANDVSDGLVKVLEPRGAQLPRQVHSPPPLLAVQPEAEDPERIERYGASFVGFASVPSPATAVVDGGRLGVPPRPSRGPHRCRLLLRACGLHRVLMLRQPRLGLDRVVEPL